MPEQQLRVLMQFSHNESLLAALGASKEVSTALLIVVCSQGGQALSLRSLLAGQHGWYQYPILHCEVFQLLHGILYFVCTRILMRPYISTFQSVLEYG